jgi:serine hydrolase
MVGVLMVPGFTGSGPNHWQSFWQREHPEYMRIEQRDWDRPAPEEWVTTLAAAIAGQNSPVVLVGHSLGCTTIVHWASRMGPGGVVGALLVAPSDVEAPTAPLEVRGFAPIPLTPLPFPSQVVASTDDPLVTVARAQAFAESWGSTFISIGRAGHINTDSGHGAWPEGHDILTRLLANRPRGPAK